MDEEEDERLCWRSEEEDEETVEAEEEPDSDEAPGEAGGMSKRSWPDWTRWMSGLRLKAVGGCLCTRPTSVCRAEVEGENEVGKTECGIAC